ncbi:hypothetical protein [Streptomyces aurantiacus]|uniref:hypothetical protein n=1 Tax=Streptomyces aurantiacus TaxID=47760 RepID=UPI00131A2683|nr:hypothetical protein [Streptomyces aurantiacus]
MLLTDRHLLRTGRRVLLGGRRLALGGRRLLRTGLDLGEYRLPGVRLRGHGLADTRLGRVLTRRVLTRPALDRLGTPDRRVLDRCVPTCGFLAERDLPDQLLANCLLPDCLLREPRRFRAGLCLRLYLYLYLRSLRGLRLPGARLRGLRLAPRALGTRHQQQVVVLGGVLGGVEEGVRGRRGDARLLHPACVLRQSLARDLAGVGHAYPSPIG